MRALLALLVVVGVVADAAAQERRALQMPASMQRPAVEAAPSEADVPPGLVRMLTPPVDAESSTSIASTGPAPGRTRLSTVDFYNNLTRSTWDQAVQGRFPGRPGAERLAGENRWTTPPAVGVVVQAPVGAPDANGSAPASIGLNAGPGVDAYGGTNGVAINARLRVPFGR